MKIIRISVSEEEYSELEKISQSKHISIQDYIREATLGRKASIFTPEEAAKRALDLPKDYGPFYLADLYTPEEWRTISVGESGVFGKKWFKYVQQIDSIEFVGMINRRARYIVNEEEVKSC